MNIGGLDAFSLIDYPGKMAAVVFAQGCNFRCPYCYNPELVLPEQYGPLLPEEKVWEFLEVRRGQLEAIVLGGGEPTLQDDLEAFLAQARRLGYATKLDTNGSCPEVLENLLKKGLLDFIAMDVKAPLCRYAEIVRAEVKTDAIQKSVRLILQSGIDHEFRTTMVKGDLQPEDFSAMAKLVCGAQQYALQRFLPKAALVDPLYSGRESLSLEELWALAPIFLPHVQNFLAR